MTLNRTELHWFFNIFTYMTELITKLFQLNTIVLIESCLIEINNTFTNSRIY